MWKRNGDAWLHVFFATRRTCLDLFFSLRLLSTPWNCCSYLKFVPLSLSPLICLHCHICVLGQKRTSSLLLLVPTWKDGNAARSKIMEMAPFPLQGWWSSLDATPTSVRSAMPPLTDQLIIRRIPYGKSMRRSRRRRKFNFLFNKITPTSMSDKRISFVEIVNYTWRKLRDVPGDENFEMWTVGTVVRSEAKWKVNCKSAISVRIPLSLVWVARRPAHLFHLSEVSYRRSDAVESSFTRSSTYGFSDDADIARVACIPRNISSSQTLF